MMQPADIFRKAREGARLTREEGLALLREAELLDLGETASMIRFRRNPEPRVTFVIDTNPNYSNICTIDCIFCAFYRHPGQEGAYTYSVDQ
ncbi:MAG TPA: dehypoxanthine futalosine cyclase, partial [Bacteroidota bacterium]